MEQQITFLAEQCLVPELAMLGWARFPKAHASLGAHQHGGAYEICYIVHGRVDWWAGNEVYDVGPGDVYITRPGEVHGGLDAMMHPNELYWLIVDLSSPAIEALAGDFAAMRLRTFPGSDQVRNSFAQLMAEHQNRGSYCAVAARSTLQQLLIAVIRDQEQAAHHRHSIQSVQIRRALRWMDKNLAEDYAVEDAAAAAGLSVGHFHERFLHEIGLTPAEHRARARIGRAKQLLRADALSITQIAMAVGFSSSQYFATVFKNLTGMTPRDYRDHLQRTALERGATARS